MLAEAARLGKTRMGPTALKSFVKPFENDPIK